MLKQAWGGEDAVQKCFKYELQQKVVICSTPYIGCTLTACQHFTTFPSQMEKLPLKTFQYDRPR